MAQNEKVRYALVGLGWIAQEAIIPGFRNASNSRLVAIVTGDPEKARELAGRYDVPQTCSYSDYERLLQSGAVDAVYIASPNSLHREHTLTAARAGVHILCEKPMAGTSADCEAMMSAVQDGGVRLMIAYRLHFESANLRAIGLITSGRIGEPRIFSSTFCQQVEEGNIRLRKDLGGGPLMDMGVYPINAARYVFRSEPAEVVAFGGNSGESRFREVHESASVILRFPGDRLASFTCGFGAAAIDQWHVAGTKGWLQLTPGFGYHNEVKLKTNIDGREQEEVIPRHDQFGAEIFYFSRCILGNREPEPSGREGLADVQIVEAALESMRTGKSVRMQAVEITTRPDESLKLEFPPAEPAVIVDASSPGGKH